MPLINPQRLLDDLRHLATFGRIGTGVHRPSLSQPDMASRRWLVRRMNEAGLEARIDGVGNVLGESRQRSKALMVGSHTDSQPRGGWLDGALGVIYGLEIVRALSECEQTRHLAIDLVSFVDEEGTFRGCLGSRSFCGDLTPSEIADLPSREDGRPLSEAITAAGLSGATARLQPDRQMAYLEAHIEQGRILESEDKRIGVVTTIVGIRQFNIRFTGEANHAGTTPMDLRKDAGMSLIEFGHQLHETLKAIAGPKTVWTIGRVRFEPGAPSIIPGSAELTFQYRDPHLEMLDCIERKVKEMVIATSAAGPVQVSISRTVATAPSAMDEGLQKHLSAAADSLAPGASIYMPSAAGHDAMVLAHKLPCAMMFVPSIGGISHNVKEDTKEEDIIFGCQVFATAATSILQSLHGSPD